MAVGDWREGRGAAHIGDFAKSAMAAALVAYSVSLAACRNHRESPSPLPSVERTPPPPSLPPIIAWDWHGIIGTGQSLGVGSEASWTTLTTQPFHNLKLSLGSDDLTIPPYDPDAPELSVVPLTEPIRPETFSFPGAYPRNIFGETPHTAMGDEISFLFATGAGGDYVTVHTVVGESGQGIQVIGKTAEVTAVTGHAYAASLFETSALRRLAAADHKTYGVGAIVVTHGETDGRNENYENDLYRLFADYNDDIRAITGQESSIPLLLTQQQTCPGNEDRPASLIAQWKIGIEHPGEIVCVGPKYQYPYAADGLHLTARGYDQVGEKYGEVYYEKIVLGRDWQPLQPSHATLRDKTIVVTFHVPVPPLVWDDRMAIPHQIAHVAWAKGRGFEVQNAGGEQKIGAVEIVANSVEIALASAPSLAGLVLRYAVTQDGHGTLGGQATGRVGQLRDSDPLVGFATRSPQYNYAVSFEIPVN